MIHRRKKIPPLPFGDVIGDAEPTRPLALAGPGAMAMAAPAAAAAQPITVHHKVQLSDVATADTASHVCEPSGAVNANVAFVTGNWFASLSTDGGNTFRYVNPYKAFPDPVGSGFCCDQVVLFGPAYDRFFWLLQYTENNKGENVQRIAYASTQNVAAGQWRFFDVSSASLGLKGCWLDFPDLALGKTRLYMTTNAFKGNSWSGTAIVRVSLDKLLSGTVVAQKIVTKDVFNFRMAQNCDTTAFWGTHVTNSRMRIYAWKDNSSAPTTFDVNIPTWSRNTPYQSITPDGRNWLERVDGRVVAATLAGNELWLGWTAGAGGVNARPNPYVQIARINTTTRQLIESINLWDPDHAICCPAFATDSNGEVGVSYSVGGQTRFPAHVVGYLTGNSTHAVTFEGQRSPNDKKWGDYLAVRRCHPAGDRLFATGYTLQNGSGNNDATPNIAIFGR
jgi:hypothetical protein